MVHVEISVVLQLHEWAMYGGVLQPVAGLRDRGVDAVGITMTALDVYNICGVS